MMERRKQELKLVEARYGELEASPTLDWFIVKRWRLSPGWSKGETQVLIQIPPGYPVTPPDNFYVDQDLRLGGGQQPGNSTPNVVLIGRQWHCFSYHVEGGDWLPHADPLNGHNLLTFLQGVDKRLAEVS
jgi:hypothetical protein